LIKTFDRLGIPLSEQKRLTGVAVDAVFDSISVGTTHQGELAKHGIIFCSMSEAVMNHPDLVQKYLGSVVPYTDNFFAALNAAVFLMVHFVIFPKGYIVLWSFLRIFVSMPRIQGSLSVP